jgi:2,3-bisphosphoglycerate-dependent phosphoglycerate mutase
MANIYLIRHAHSDWTPDEMRPLSAQGRDDAKRLVEHFKGIGVSAIYTSPYLRAKQTVEPLARLLNLSLIEDDDLREQALGNHLGRWDTVHKAMWDDPGLRFPGGESNLDAKQRVLEAWRRIVASSSGGNAVIATHGNAMSLLLQAFDPSIGFDFWQSLRVPDIYQAEISNDGGICAYRRLEMEAR